MHYQFIMRTEVYWGDNANRVAFTDSSEVNVLKSLIGHEVKHVGGSENCLVRALVRSLTVIRSSGLSTPSSLQLPGWGKKDSEMPAIP